MAAERGLFGLAPAWILEAHAAHRCSYSGDEARRAHSVGAGECARSASEARQRLPRAQGALGPRLVSFRFVLRHL